MRINDLTLLICRQEECVKFAKALDTDRNQEIRIRTKEVIKMEEISQKLFKRCELNILFILVSNKIRLKFLLIVRFENQDSQSGDKALKQKMLLPHGNYIHPTGIMFLNITKGNEISYFDNSFYNVFIIVN